MKTIAQLEAAADAAHKAYGAAVDRRAAMHDLCKAIDALRDLSNDPALLPSDVKNVAAMPLAGAWLEAVATRDALTKEIDRLEDASLAAQRALNDAPEEAA